jgi:hypothetical protein
MDREQLTKQYDAITASIRALETAGITDEATLAPLHEQRQALERRLGDVSNEDAAVPGTTFRGTRGVRSVAGVIPVSSVAIWVFGWWCPWRIPNSELLVSRSF